MKKVCWEKNEQDKHIALDQGHTYILSTEGGGREREKEGKEREREREREKETDIER